MHSDMWMVRSSGVGSNDAIGEPKQCVHTQQDGVRTGACDSKREELNDVEIANGANKAHVWRFNRKQFRVWDVEMMCQCCVELSDINCSVPGR